MKTLELSIPQRIFLITFLNGFEGYPYETLVEVWKMLDKVKFTEDEKANIGMTSQSNAEGKESIQWSPEKANYMTTIEFTDEQSKVFIDRFERLSKENKLDASTYPIAQIYEKLKTS